MSVAAFLFWLVHSFFPATALGDEHWATGGGGGADVIM
jgi:hypothetical protein